MLILDISIFSSCPRIRLFIYGNAVCLENFTVKTDSSRNVYAVIGCVGQQDAVSCIMKVHANVNPSIARITDARRGDIKEKLTR